MNGSIVHDPVIEAVLRTSAAGRATPLAFPASVGPVIANILTRPRNADCCFNVTRRSNFLP